MKTFRKFILVSLILVINTAYSNTINGIDIPDELFYKLCEYRNRLVSDTAAGAKYEQDISVNELNYFFKSKVKYDALHYCCFCKVNYPISSQILNKSYSKQDRICLDGFPEISDFILPPEWIKYIIGVDKWLLSRKDSFGNGAMHISAKFGNLAVVKLLQKLGCKIDEFNNQKQSPMFLAIRYGHFDVVDYLLSQGANPFIEDYKGNNALQLACIGKNIEGGRILNKLIKIAKIKQDTFETMI